MDKAKKAVGGKIAFFGSVNPFTLILKNLLTKSRGFSYPVSANMN
jgi:hypothetical protein